MKKRVTATILTAVMVILSVLLFAGCSNDEPEETYPYYTFPTESEPLKEGAYFITDLGYKEYQLRYESDSQYDRDRLYVAILNSQMCFGISAGPSQLSYENGLYYGGGIFFYERKKSLWSMICCI